MERTNHIQGTISSKHGDPVAGLIVRAYSMGLRREEQLGEAVVDRNGAYRITWSRPATARDQTRPSATHIGLKVSTPGNVVVFNASPDDVRYDAGQIEEINVVITEAIKPEVIEYEAVLAAVTAAGTTLDQLEENDNHRDVALLSRSANVSAEKIEHAALAQRLEQRSNIEAPFFYALLRQNTLLRNDLTKPLQLQFSIGINTDVRGVLYDAALADPEAMQRDIAQATKDKIIGEIKTAVLQRHLKTLAGMKAEAEKYTTEERVQRITDVVTQFVLQDKLGEAAKLFKSNKHDLTGVIKKVSNVKFLGNISKVRDLKTTLALGELVGYDQSIISQIGKAHGIKEPADIRRLAKLDKADWKTELTKSASKITIGSKHIDKKLVDLHASSLVRKLEKTYPTQAFVAQLERESKPVLNRQKEITALLNKHEDFDLQTSNIDLFFKDKKLAGKDHEITRDELKKVQRVFRLTPNYSKANALLKQNVTSARDITTMGKTKFLKQVAPAAGLSAKEADVMYAKAETTSTAVMIVAGELQDISAAAPIPAFNTLKLGEKVEGVTTDFPNLKSLFKAGDTCACDHCRSVYGPAAYLVELLEFVDNRSVTDLTVTPHVTTNKAQDVLFERRPDLGELDLSCANAMTPLPYIDLVNEHLEELIAPDAGITYSGNLSSSSDPLVGNIAPSLLSALQAKNVSITNKAQVFATETTGSSATLPHYIRDKQAVLKAVHTGGNNYKIYRLRQTLSPAEELAAAPEYVNAKAYTELATHAYAFGLPFDLNHTEARAYFERFDINRAALMQTFQVGTTPPNSAIAAEVLNLTDTERTLIITPDTANQQDYWNTTGAPVTELKAVDTFLNKTGLTYDELVRLLTLRFIDPADKLFIKHLDLSCDLTQKEIANLDNAALDRMHRFLRLQKKTGWKFETVDEVISQTNLGAEQLNDATLQVAADLTQLAKDTGLKIDELVGGFGDIAHDEIEGRSGKPLYHQVFLNKAKNGAIDEALMPEKVNGSGFLADVASSLAVSLQVKESELPTLFLQLVDNKLTFENLSYLYLLTRLMRKLKLKAAELDVLIDLTGTNPTMSPADALEFAREARVAKEQPLKLAAIRYMLYHQADDITALELKDEVAQKSLESLQAAYQAAYAANKSPFDLNLAASEQLEAFAKQLGQFPEVVEEDAKALASFLNREWTSPAAAKTLVDSLFGSLFDTTAIKTAIDTLAAVAPAGDISQESKDLLQTFMDAIAGHQFLAAKRAALEAQISSAFKADLDTTSVVLARAILKQPAPGTTKLQDILLANDLIDTTNPVPAPPAISEAVFGQHYNSLRLLHKLLPLIASYELQPETIDWLLAHSADLGWMEWDAIPYRSGHVEVAYEKYADLTRVLQLASQLSPVVNPTDANQPITFWSVLEMLLPGSTATRDLFLEHLALLTGYEKASLDEIDAHFFPVFDLTQYRQVAVLDRMFEAAEYARRLAGSMQNIVGYIKPTLVATDATALRLSLKSRYDETTWLDTLKEIMDAIRPQKRDALVAYLLATRPEFKSENDLYDHLLIDVEMEACMPSSRIVQAHGTIQLFVQRCLMGLEPQAAADTENDSGWEQWKWLKLYRVREVNHKIFLYPENWIEAELRDDKSFIFNELEDELQQNELTEFTAERALTGYLERLDGLAFLEVVATWYQTKSKTMHVFARSKGGDPAIYYHRKFEQERSWTPWTKVDVEITGNHLLAFERNNRLTLAWPVFSEEPDPNPQSTAPNQMPGTLINNEKPKRKLKIQLAVSEFADNMWQPKRVSQDAIRTPHYYTNEDLQQHAYNLIYIEAMDQILVIKGLGQDYTELRGVFDIAGCKGYPELASEGQSYFPDFFPDFKDTILNMQRYRETNQDSTQDLAARTALAPYNFYQILGQTPDNFRLTYPHQMTLIDWVALLMQYFLHAANSQQSTVGHEGRFKIPLGTLLPYFMEDSSHAYVITPGFYERKGRVPRGEEPTDEAAEASTAVVQRTASNVLQLIEDIIALYTKYLAKLQSGQSPASVIQELLADEDYHDVVAELKVYGGLHYGEKFSNMYHPLICALRKVLYKEGIPALMKRPVQLQQTSFNFDAHYNPSAIVPQKYPVENIDFESDGSYSSYNWELFFHVPMMIATQFTHNQKFEEAMDWLHYIFNPTGALPGDAPQKYWVTKPFFLRNDSEYIEQRIDTLLYKIADPNTPEIKELEFAIQQWREKPFRPHVVARFRTVAYQKAILMKYIDNLIEWGDYLFRQDTMESIAQATQMYVMADKLLGPKPRTVPPVVKPPDETYNQIQAKLGPLGNALIDLENILPDLSVLPEEGAELPPAPITLSTLYFCIPQNEQMLAYWDRIADRLFKIRNCQNIEGIERSLALFAPPIDPAMLVRAAASGLDISSIIAGLNAPLPYYRFSVLSQKAADLANEVRSLGSSLLQALEKKDAEELALLRSEQEISVLNAVTEIKKLGISEATEQIEVLKRTRLVTEERHKFYAEIEKINAKEQLNLDKLEESHDLQLGAQISRTLAGVVAMVPDLLGGASGIGGSPHVTLQWGGKNLAAAANSAADVLGIFSSIATYEATRAATLGSYDRRMDDWKLQERTSQKELDSIDKQIAAAEIRKELAETELKNHELQIKNAKQTDEYMRSKFTNQELYQWMIGQISSIYFSSYKLAHDMAKKAERTYQFELGRDDSYIAFGYWDSMKKGLQCADHLISDIKRMEVGYLDRNKREYEITKYVSLASLDPLALARLRATSSCDFDVPEAVFDMDHAGQYFRRIKSVSVNIPAVAGPNTSVSAKLSLISNKYRKNTNPDSLAGTGYAEDPGNDDRFTYNVGTIQSIATSESQQDNGLFELNFKDDRYLPFEGTGAISSWRLELPKKELAQFNYDTIADVVLQINLTAREGGSGLRSLAETTLLDRLAELKQELSQTGLHTAINMKHEMPNEWHLLKSTGSVESVINKDRLPYLAQALDATIENVVVLAKVAGNPANFVLKVDGSDLNLSRINDWKVCKGETTAVTLDEPVVLSLTPANLAKLEELVLVVKYGF